MKEFWCYWLKYVERPLSSIGKINVCAVKSSIWNGAYIGTDNCDLIKQIVNRISVVSTIQENIPWKKCP